MKTTSTRRSLFAGASAVVMGSGITAGFAASVADLVPLDPEADLLAICAQAEEADRLMLAANRLHQSITESRIVRDAARRESDDRFDQFVDLCQQATKILPARAPEGMRAKARLAYLDASETMDRDDFTMVILRDLGWPTPRSSG